MHANQLVIRHYGLQPYETMLNAMHEFTSTRNENTTDEIWLVEHPPVFTQGQAGKPEHLLLSSDIPLVQSDRGGQVTYHGPGQLVAYFLVDIRRKSMGVRELVTNIETLVVDTLRKFDIASYPRADAPGVYVDDKKICSLGLRIRKGCSFHGLALNVNMDLLPFTYINPCGYAGMAMTQTVDLNGPSSLSDIIPVFIQTLTSQLGYDQVESLMESN